MLPAPGPGAAGNGRIRRDYLPGVERLISSDLRTLRIYKSRGGAYKDGRQAYCLDDDGIQFAGSYAGEADDAGAAT